MTAPARQPLDELDKKIQRFVAVYATGISMHDHAVLCEGIMDIVAEYTSPPAPAIHLCCDICGSPAPHFDGKDQWLCTKCIQAAAAKAAREKVLEVVTQLYDEGFKDPLVTLECAIAYIENPTVEGHPEKQKMKSLRAQQQQGGVSE